MVAYSPLKSMKHDKKLTIWRDWELLKDDSIYAITYSIITTRT